MARIVNMKREPHAVVDGAVRIDRRTPWGNPFVVGRDGTRAQVIARYRADLWRRVREGEIELRALAALDGRDLACHCAPLPCHGEVLARAAAWAAASLRAREAERGARGANGAERRGRSGAPPSSHRENPMSHIAFKRIGPHEARIHQDGDCVGNVYRHDDILNPGSHYFVIHLFEDWRGPRRVRERQRIREVAQRMVDTHPFYG